MLLISGHDQVWPLILAWGAAAGLSAVLGMMLLHEARRAAREAEGDSEL